METTTKKKQDFGLYGILTDPVVGYEALTEIMTDRGVRYIQLRMKNVNADEIRETAARLRKIVTLPSMLIINDHVKIAADIGADGVHLGQDDISYESARKILGNRAIIGLSTHTPDQTDDACRRSPDYIGVGPVFPTPTKAIADPAIGLSGMSDMISRATVPAVAIGGIDLDNVETVLANGARNLCAVRCINQSTTPEKELDALIEIISSQSKSAS